MVFYLRRFDIQKGRTVEYLFVGLIEELEDALKVKVELDVHPESDGDELVCEEGDICLDSVEVSITVEVFIDLKSKLLSSLCQYYLF